MLESMYAVKNRDGVFLRGLTVVSMRVSGRMGSKMVKVDLEGRIRTFVVYGDMES